MRLHFLLTGEIPGYWYNAQADVLLAYMNYYEAKLWKPMDDKEKKYAEKAYEVFATHKFGKTKIEDYILPNLPDCQGYKKPLRYFNFFSKDWLKQEARPHKLAEKSTATNEVTGVHV